MNLLLLRSNVVIYVTLTLATLFALVPVFTLADGPKPCTQDITCKTGQFCLNGQCALRACSWTNDDLSCAKFNSTTWCNKDQGQCIPRTAQLNAACEPRARENSCAEGFLCDPATSKCLDGQGFWDKYKTYVIVGIVMVVTLACCAVACLCGVVKKGVGLLKK